MKYSKPQVFAVSALRAICTHTAKPNMFSDNDGSSQLATSAAYEADE